MLRISRWHSSDFYSGDTWFESDQSTTKILVIYFSLSFTVHNRSLISLLSNFFSYCMNGKEYYPFNYNLIVIYVAEYICNKQWIH
jgi:hypothetical protein